MASLNSESKPLIVFTHQFAGTQKSLWRHIELVQKLGFKTVAFDFTWDGQKVLRTFYGLTQGLSHRWSYELEKVLDAHDGPKIIYAFSGPAAGAVECIARRFKKGNFDVVGLVCDSGPFLNAWRCTNNLLKFHYGFESRFLRHFLLTPAMVMLWGFNHKKVLANSASTIAHINPNFPIQSFRSEKDLLVPVEEIDNVFKDRGLTNLHPELMVGCSHLTALKEAPEIYTEKLTRFLSRFRISS